MLLRCSELPSSPRKAGTATVAVATADGDSECGADSVSRANLPRSAPAECRVTRPQRECNQASQTPGRHRQAKKGPIDLRAFAGTGHHALDELQWSHRLAHELERCAATGPLVRGQVCDPDMAPCDQHAGARRHQRDYALNA